MRAFKPRLLGSSYCIIHINNANRKHLQRQDNNTRWRQDANIGCLVIFSAPNTAPEICMQATDLASHSH